ncbi:MAG: hypothetical protein JWO36_4540 [Myxococcales bacterium]|nr:hypothetical protein [Myxococcales bacterium]
MRYAVVIGICVFGCFGTARADAKEDRREVGGLTYALPAGWKSEMEGPDHARLTHADAKRYCIISLYESRAAAADLDAEFAKEWQAVAGPLKDQKPTPVRRKVVGRTVLEVSAPATVSGTALLQRVVVLDGGAQVTTLVIFTADAAAAVAYQKAIDGIIASIRFPAAAPAAQAPAAQAPAAQAPVTTERPDRVLIGTLQPTVTLADLAGTWSYGAGSVATYVDSSTGSYAGTSTVFFGETYVIKANGAFDYKFTGRSGNHTVREADGGTVTLSGGFVTFQFKGARGTKKLQLIAFVNQPSGASVLTFSPTGKDGVGQTAEWIASYCNVVKGVYACVGSEEWGRAPRKSAK